MQTAQDRAQATKADADAWRDGWNNRGSWGNVTTTGTSNYVYAAAVPGSQTFTAEALSR